MSFASALLTKPAVAGLTIPGAATIATCGWKVLASRNEPSADDWAVGFDLLLAAAALQLTFLGDVYRVLETSLGSEVTLFLLHLGWLVFASIFALTFVMAVALKSVPALWRAEETFYNGSGGQLVLRYRWCLRPGTAFGTSVLGGSVLSLVFIANTQYGYLYAHAQWLRRI